MPSSNPDHLIPPHGGQLIDLVVEADRAAELKEASVDFPSWDLTDRQLNDLELLANGGFSPLTGFLGKEEYDTVIEDMRLPDGTLWPMPITLDIDGDTAAALSPGASLALRDPEGVMLAVLQVSDVWEPDKDREALQVLGSNHPEHPAVAYLMETAGSHYVGGRLEVLDLPSHYDFAVLRMSPAETRARFTKRGWRKVVAFQT
ncbi:MAG: adenylyltransferase, partial [Acidimicrobiia bacterium]